MNEVGGSQIPLYHPFCIIFVFVFVFSPSDFCFIYPTSILMLAETKFQESLVYPKMDLNMVSDYSLCLHELGFDHIICLMVQAIWKQTPSWVTRLRCEIINIKLSINKSGSRLPKTFG